MRRAFSALMMVAVLAGGVAQAQTPPAPPAPPGRGQAPAPPKPIPKPTVPEEVATPAQLVNIRIDVAVTEEGGTHPPLRKTATVMTTNGRAAAVRASGEADVPGPAGRAPDPFRRDRMNTYMKMDVRPWLERDGRIRTLITMEYLSPTSQQGGRGTTLQMEPLLESGKPLRASESTDPTSDRKVSVEVTATILK